MATLAADSVRQYGHNIDPQFNDLPVIADDIIYEGAAVGDNGSGGARPLEAGDPFWGFAERQADNAGGSAGDINVHVRSRGEVVLAVTGVEDADDIGEVVYASDDDTFTLTAGANTDIGKVVRHISSTTCVVYFEADYLQSL